MLSISGKTIASVEWAEGSSSARIRFTDGTGLKAVAVWTQCGMAELDLDEITSVTDVADA